MAVIGHPPMATLGLFAEHLDPPQVNRIMAVEPDTSARKGEPLFRRSSGKSVPARTGTWFLTTENRQLDGPAAHLDWVVTLASSHMTQLRDSIPDLQMELSLLVYDPDFEPTYLPEDLLERSVKVGELEIEVPDKHAGLVINAGNVHRYVRR